MRAPAGIRREVLKTVSPNARFLKNTDNTATTTDRYDSYGANASWGVRRPTATEKPNPRVGQSYRMDEEETPKGPTDSSFFVHLNNTTARAEETKTREKIRKFDMSAAGTNIGPGAANLDHLLAGDSVAVPEDETDMLGELDLGFGSSTLFSMTAMTTPGEKLSQNVPKPADKGGVVVAEMARKVGYAVNTIETSQDKVETVVYRGPTGKRMQLTRSTSVRQFSEVLGVAVDPLMRKLKQLDRKKWWTPESQVDEETQELMAIDEGKEYVNSKFSQRLINTRAEAKHDDPRCGPVVCVMGHVDHGKTTLLDTLRETNIAAGEAGGITQSIGAFSFKMGEYLCTFLDTPGHASFHTMRKKGAQRQLTDLVVLVVAADDGVQPQTKEAIKLCLAGNMPMVVAINKCDIAGVNAARVKQELMTAGVVVEELGGEVLCVEISAKTKLGVEDLKEAIELTAEMADIRSPVEAGNSYACVVEARIQKGVGPVCSIITRKGTIRVRDFVVSGMEYARIKALKTSDGKSVKSSSPFLNPAVSLIGFKELDHIGSDVIAVATEGEAREAVAARLADAELKTDSSVATKKDQARVANQLPGSETIKINSWRSKTIVSKISDDTKAEAGLYEDRALRLVVKSDSLGTLQVVQDYIARLPQHEMVHAEVVSSGLGNVTLSDVEQAALFKAVIVGFNVGIESKASKAADTAKVEVVQSKIVYRLMDAVQDKLGKLMPTETVTQTVGRAEVAMVFELKEKKSVFVAAGIKVYNGHMKHKDHTMQVRRGEDILWKGECKVLKHFKDEVDMVESGNEGAVRLDGFEDYKVGDVIECVGSVEQHKKFDDSVARMGVTLDDNVGYQNTTKTRKKRQHA